PPLLDRPQPPCEAADQRPEWERDVIENQLPRVAFEGVATRGSWFSMTSRSHSGLWSAASQGGSSLGWLSKASPWRDSCTPATRPKLATSGAANEDAVYCMRGVSSA